MDYTKILNVDQFRKFITNAKAGAICQYHRGFILRDRDRSSAPRDLDDKHVIEISKVALELYDAGLANLVQKRIGDDDYLYLAIRTSKQVETPKPKSAVPALAA